jgi:hypothetical protein
MAKTILRPLGQIRIPGPKEDVHGMAPKPEIWLVPYYRSFFHGSEAFLVIDAQIANHEKVHDGRFGYTIVHRRTGMGAKEVCEQEPDAAMRKGMEVCLAKWSPRVEAAIAGWPVLNP